MTDIHPCRGRKTVLPFSRIPEDRQVCHTNMHCHVGEPGKKHDMPEGKLALAFQWYACPYFRIGNFPEISKRVDAQLGHDSQGRCDKYQNHPGCGKVSETGYLFIAQYRYYSDHHPDQ